MVYDIVRKCSNLVSRNGGFCEDLGFLSHGLIWLKDGRLLLVKVTHKFFVGMGLGLAVATLNDAKYF